MSRTIFGERGPTTPDEPHPLVREFAGQARGSRDPSLTVRFTILEQTPGEKRSRRRSVLVSALCQFVLLLGVTYLGVLLNIIEPPEPPRVIRAFLYIPKGPNPEPPPPKPAPPPPRPAETARLREPLVVPPPKISMPPPPVVKHVLPPMNLPAPPPLKAPKPQVVEGAFSKATPAEAPKKAPGTVVAASFGAPAIGAPARPSSQDVSVGGFGIGGTPHRGQLMLPQGGNIYHPVGFGDSSGGSSGAGGHARPPGNVQTGGSGFDNSLYASASANPSATKRAEPRPDFIPAEIVFKPRPEYTDVARREKIEGEVLLEALFTAGGQITNIRVQQGLGYGLNEMAVKAAQQIQFKPAKKNGAPVDSVAAIRIIFKLAY